MKIILPEEITIVMASRADGNYILQVAYNNFMYLFNVPVVNLGTRPTELEVKQAAITELQKKP